ncbi:co-chaperone protein HscB [Cordyceps javanica]|uniref:Co-chaperone protein HscB n=1 Tax=Cordyceps javanica TaxID=43265 RepID=A0A545V533_9HYPO|nr:co-chaperone protein HscB [Cordyceps javanica]TQW08086.1 co-chaperone protein HscB [Cordyceps javanica]
MASLAARFTTACGHRKSTSKTRPQNRSTVLGSLSSLRRDFSHQPAQRRAGGGAAVADSSEPPAATSSSSSSSSSPAPSTHYDLFPATLPLGPPPSGHFPIDVRALRREFLRLQARAHPDMHPPGEAKTRAEAQSARINEAYRTLANPLLRAQYLLALRGVDVAGDERMRLDEPALLATVLEAREDIEDARDEADLAAVRAANEARIADGEEALEAAFRRDDVDAAKNEAVRMRYWVNIRESLDNWEPGKPIVLEH